MLLFQRYVAMLHMITYLALSFSISYVALMSEDCSFSPVTTAATTAFALALLLLYVDFYRKEQRVGHDKRNVLLGFAIKTQ